MRKHLSTKILRDLYQSASAIGSVTAKPLLRDSAIIVWFEQNTSPTIRLSQPCLPESCSGFSATFTTIAFDNSSLRWLEINT
jgi:hypothetical protein